MLVQLFAVAYPILFKWEHAVDIMLPEKVFRRSVLYANSVCQVSACKSFLRKMLHIMADTTLRRCLAVGLFLLVLVWAV